MTRNRTKVWDLNYVTVIMSETTKPYEAILERIHAGSRAEYRRSVGRHDDSGIEDSTALRNRLRSENAHDDRVGGDGRGPFPVPFDMPVDVRWPESPHARQSGLGIAAMPVAP
jgi:hypothetical protein